MNVNHIKAQRILSPTQISLAPFAVNPYRGCPFGCVYCYAQHNKSIQKKKEPWGSFVDAKINAVELLTKEIQGKKIERVLLGSTVECYPPQEEQLHLTRGIIEVLNASGSAATILTKSTLIERDLELIARYKRNKIYLTINFDREETRRLFEPASPTIHARLLLLEKIVSAGIPTRIHIAPVIPFIQHVGTIVSMLGFANVEVSIELYNVTLGNWLALKRIIQKNFPEEILSRIENCIATFDSYKTYAEDFLAEMKMLEKKFGRKITVLVPGFKEYYKSEVRYEESFR